MPYYSWQVDQRRSGDPKRYRYDNERDPQNPSEKAQETARSSTRHPNTMRSHDYARHISTHTRLPDSL